MVVPLTAVLVLRLLALYDGAAREAMSLVGPLMVFVLAPTLLFFGWRHGRPRWVHGALRLDGDGLELATDRGTERFDRRGIIAGVRHDAARGGFELRLDHGQVIGGEMLTAAPGASVDSAGLLRALGSTPRDAPSPCAPRRWIPRPSAPRGSSWASPPRCSPSTR